jgi:flavorubredoxin
MAATIRLMPNHDPHWRDKLATLQQRHSVLLACDGLLTVQEQRELMHLRQAMDRTLNSRFRTTAEYRDFYFARARQLLDDEGIDLTLPDVAADATVEEIDRVLGLVWAAVEVTDSETF